MPYHYLLISWFIIYILIVRSRWKKKLPSVGLAFAYFWGLMVNHWFGGWIHSLTWHQTADTKFVRLGFEQATYSAIAFGAGCIFLAPLLLRIFGPGSRSIKERVPHPSLPEVYILTGIIFYSVLTPFLGRIPSIRTPSYSGWSLVILGLCLALWRAWRQKQKKNWLFWICCSIILPFFTMVTMGFLGYGISALLVVFLFIFSFYRPRWHLLIGSLVAVYFGLSFFVTYLRDRDELREKVWGGAQMSARVEQVKNMVLNFEWFDIHDKKHLLRIDDRLNQNILVGQAVDYLASGQTEFARGETLWHALIAMIPRLLWPNKPVVAGSGDLVTRFTGIRFAESTSVGIGQVMEFYVNFGTPCVVIGFMILGSLITWVDVTAARYLAKGDWQGYVFWALPGIGFLQAGGSLVEVTSSVISSIVFCILINKFILPRFAGKRWRSRMDWSSRFPAFRGHST